MSTLKDSIVDKLVDGKLTCAGAFDIALEHKVDPIEVGKEATRSGIRISRCQLGLFGYEDLGSKRIVQEAQEVAPKLKRAIESKLEKGELSCKGAWDISSELTVPKLAVAGAAEKMSLRFRKCQLGCFA